MLQEVWNYIAQNPAFSGALAAAVSAAIAILKFFGVRRAVISIASTAPSAFGWGSSTSLDVHYQVRPLKNSNYVVVENENDSSVPAEILGIGVTEGEDDPFASNGPPRKLPAMLEPGQDVKFLAALHKGCGPPHEVKVDWKPKNGKERTLRKTVYK